MKCKNCGEELDGKFCTNCGTPAPVDEQPTEVNATEGLNPVQPVEPVQPAQPVQPVEPAQPVQPVEPVQPVQSVQPVQPVQPVGQTQNYQTSYGQQFTNQPNTGYAGQQFTNQPVNGKKPMSTGKILGLVFGIVGGVLLLLIIICVIIFSAACNKAKDYIKDNVDSSTVSEFLSDVEDFASDIENYENSASDILSSYNESSSQSEEKLDSVSHFLYTETADGMVIQGYDYDSMQFESGKTSEIKVPKTINGKNVVEVKALFIYASSDDAYIKIVIPGTVKKIDSYAMSFVDSINEVVIEDGVQEIEYNAFIGSENLKKVSVPASVKIMDDCGLGLDPDDETWNYEPINGFVMTGVKGSVAETYCTKNGLKFEAK